MLRRLWTVLSGARVFLFVAAVTCAACDAARGQTPPGKALEATGSSTSLSSSTAATSEASGESTAAGADVTGRSEAERYASVRRLLTADRARLAGLQEEAKRLETEFETASAEFSRIDGELNTARAQVTAATTAQDKADAIAKTASLESDWKPSRDAFDQIIQHRKAVARQLETLTAKIELEETFLKQMSTPEGASLNPEASDAAPRAPVGTPAATEMVPPVEAAPAATPSAPSESPAPVSTAPVPAAPVATAPPATTAPAPAVPTTPAPAPANGAAPKAPAPSATSMMLPGVTLPTSLDPNAAAATPPAEVTTGDAAADEELMVARREQQEKETALKAAKRRVEGLNKAIIVFERDQQATEALLEAAKKQYESALASETALVQRMREASDVGVTADDLTKLEQRRRDAETQRDQARNDVEVQTARLAESKEAIEHLKQSRAKAVEAVEVAEKAVEPARSRVWYLESPITPGRVWRRLVEVGPKIVGIISLMFVLWYLAKLVASRQIMNFALRGRRGSTEERESRAATLRRVFENAAGIGILLIGGLAVLDQIGVNVTVLLGGAAVLGAALAFGSQNLIKDFFSGFMILVENQYSVGNIVRIGGVSGSVEDISLRMTVLRDEEGVVHFIPHNQITMVSNLTYGWSRAVFNLRVSYGENVDDMMRLIMEIAREMRDDETFGPKMLGQPEMSGVDEIADAHVTIKFLVKTRPLQQWSVKRELLRRIKNKFDALGIRRPAQRFVVENQSEPLASETADLAKSRTFGDRNGIRRDDIRQSRY